MAGGDGQDGTVFQDGANCVIVNVANRIPQQRSGRSHHKLGRLADPHLGLGPDAYEARLAFHQGGVVSALGEFVERGPMLTGLGHILSLVHADRTEGRSWFISFNSAGGADQHGPRLWHGVAAPEGVPCLSDAAPNRSILRVWRVLRRLKRPASSPGVAAFRAGRTSAQ